MAKKLLLSFLILLLVYFSVGVVKAQTDLTLFTSSGESFVLYVNGERINAEPSENVKAKALVGEGCKVKAVFNTAAIPPIEKFVVLEQNKSLIFEIKKGNNGKYGLRLISNTDRPANDVEAMDGSQASSFTGNSKPEMVPSRDQNNERVNKGNSTSKEETVSASISVGSISADMNISVKENSTAMGSVQAESKETKVGYSNPYDKYRNKAGFCPIPSLAAQPFMQMKIELERLYLNTEKSSKVLQVVESNCTTSRQLAEMIQYIKSDQFKYSTAMSAFAKLYDPGYFDIVTATITDRELKEKLDSFALSYLSSDDQSVSGGYNAPLSDNSGSCVMTDSQYQDGLRSIESKSFQETKISTAKLVLKNKCVSVLQVKGFARLIENDDDKLDYLKYAYDFTTNKQDYYQCADILTFDSAQEELNEFLAAKK